MFKINYFKTIWFFAVLAIVLSCGDKDSPVYYPDGQDSYTTLLDNAKDYFDKKTRLSGLKTADDGKGKKKLAPLWTKAKKTKLENGDAVLMVPVPEYKVNSNELGFFRCYIFKESNGNIVDGRIVEFLGDIDYIDRSNEEIVKKMWNPQIDKFNGSVVSYDLNYEYIEGYLFRKGKKQNATAKIATTTKATGSAGDARVSSTLRTQSESYCTYTYLVTYYSDGTEVWTPMYSTCSGGGDTPPPGGGGPSTVPQTGIKNNLTYPCFKMVFDHMLNGQFNNKVQNILQNFAMSPTLSFTITQEADATKTRAAYYNPSNQTIVLNTYVLANASQEYVTNVIYHEVLHVYLTGATALSDHNKMANDYVQPMVEALQTWFSIPTIDATALAWTGLQGTGAWNGCSIAEQNSMIDLQLIYQNYGSNCH